MSYLDDLKELERQDRIVTPMDLVKQCLRPPERPDKLAPYRDQRWGRPDRDSIEPEIV